jgi:type I restriction enzyme M protein
LSRYAAVSSRFKNKTYVLRRSGGMNMKELDFSSPRELGTTMATLLEPQASEKIYDGAFGELSFLLAIKDYIDRRDEKENYHSTDIYGKEINADIYQRAIEKAKKHNININNFTNENTIKQISKSVQKYDVVISCPPFGLKTENDYGELGIKTTDGVNKFLQHYINSLVNGGRAAIVVTNSFLYSNSKATIDLRKSLIENCNLHTVLGLPPKTFSYAGVNTSVLFFIKGKSTKEIKYYSKELDEGYSEFIDYAVNNIKNERSFVFSVENLNNETFALPDAKWFAIEKEVKEKTKNFETFKCYKIENICLEVNLTNEGFEEKKCPLFAENRKIFQPN